MSDTIHFIYPVTEKTRPWSPINDLAVKLACKHHGANRIMITTNDPSRLSPWVRENIDIANVVLQTHIDGVEIKYPQYISDIMRLQILSNYGGIYMDTDMLLLKPIADLMSDKLVLSWENPQRTSICNALMMSPPDNMFVNEWLRRLPKAMESATWANGGVVLPAQMASNPYLNESCEIFPHTFACALDLSQRWLFDPSLKDEATSKIKDSYAIHVFETYWRDHLSFEEGSLFTELQRSV
jgi:hypothetical protein